MNEIAKRGDDDDDDNNDSIELVFAHSYSKNSHECASKICFGKQFSF